MHTLSSLNDLLHLEQASCALHLGPRPPLFVGHVEGCLPRSVDFNENIKKLLDFGYFELQHPA